MVHHHAIRDIRMFPQQRDSHKTFFAIPFMRIEVEIAQSVQHLAYGLINRGIGFDSHDRQQMFLFPKESALALIFIQYPMRLVTHVFL